MLFTTSLPSPTLYFGNQAFVLIKNPPMPELAAANTPRYNCHQYDSEKTVLLFAFICHFKEKRQDLVPPSIIST